MAEAVDSVVNSVSQSAQKVKKDVVDTFNKALESTDDLSERMKETLTFVSDKTKNFSESFNLDSVTEGAKKVADSVTESLDKVPEKVKETLNLVSEGAQGLFDKVKENVGDLLDTQTAAAPGAKQAEPKPEAKPEPKPEPKAEPKAEPEGPEYVEEEEVVEGDWKARKVSAANAQVEVKEIKVETGEEDEEVFWKQRSKLYRWATDTDGSGMWKERGLGEAKLLKHKETGKIRFLLRQEKTFKVVANHYVLETNGMCKLTPNVGSDKIWVWSAHNTLEDENKVEQMALKFPNADQAKLFKEKFEEAARLNKPLFEKAE